MYYTVPYKTKQFFFVLIKLSLVVGAFYFIYKKLIHNDTLSFSDFTAFSSQNGVFSIKNVFFLLILSFFNWFFEILKWKNLVSPVKAINFKNAIAQSLGSLTASLITPNRIGEYGAKAMYYTSKLRKRILVVNLISNLIQMSVTVILGSIGFYIYVITYKPDLHYYELVKYSVILLIVLFLLGLVITKSKFTFKGFSLKNIKHFLAAYPKRKLILGFLFSGIRYVIFSFQFYILLLIFHVNLGYLEDMVIITSMYLIASVIPSIFIFDVIVKGGIAVYLFSLVGVNELIILSVITLMWLLNFVVPSLFGSYYVLKFKLPENKDYI